MPLERFIAVSAVQQAKKDIIAVSLFVDWLSLTNTESESNPKQFDDERSSRLAYRYNVH